MSEHLTRKEIKHDIREDAVRMWLERIFGYLAANTWVILVAGALVLVAIGAVVGVDAYVGSRQAAANDLLGHAVLVYDAPVDAASADPDDPLEPTFASEEARTERARELLEQVRTEYPGSGPAAVAAVYLGRIHLQAGDEETTRELWGEFLSRGRTDMLTSMVKVSLLELDREGGRGEEVVSQIETALDADDRDLPMDVLLYELAVTLESIDQPERAQETYQRLGDEYPDSPYAQRALTRATELEAGV